MWNFLNWVCIDTISKLNLKIKESYMKSWLTIRLFIIIQTSKFCKSKNFKHELNLNMKWIFRYYITWQHSIGLSCFRDVEKVEHDLKFFFFPPLLSRKITLFEQVENTK